MSAAAAPRPGRRPDPRGHQQHRPARPAAGPDDGRALRARRSRSSNESLEWDERFGSVPGHLANLIFRAWAQLFAGDLASAAEDAGEALRLSRAYGMGPGVAWSAWIRAEALLEMGRGRGRGRCSPPRCRCGEQTPAGWHWMNFGLARARMLLARRRRRGGARRGRPGRRNVRARRAASASTWIGWRPVACRRPAGARPRRRGASSWPRRSSSWPGAGARRGRSASRCGRSRRPTRAARGAARPRPSRCSRAPRRGSSWPRR